LTAITQWRNQGRGSRGRCRPLELNSDQNIVVSVVHTTSQSHFSFYEKRSVAETENMQKMNLRPGLRAGPHTGSSRRPQNP